MTNKKEEKISKFELDWEKTAEIYTEKYNIMRDKTINLCALLFGTVALLIVDWIIILNIIIN